MSLISMIFKGIIDRDSVLVFYRSMEISETTKTGTQHYKAKGLKSFLVHLKPEKVKRLKLQATREDKSLTAYASEVLSKQADRVKA